MQSTLHPGWMALAGRLGETERHLVFLERYDSSGDWGACSCCSANQGRVVWVVREDHFSRKPHLRAVRNGHVTPMHITDRGDPFVGSISGVPVHVDRIGHARRESVARGTLPRRSRLVPDVSGRSPDISVFYPAACQSDEIMDGAFIIDSCCVF